MGELVMFKNQKTYSLIFILGIVFFSNHCTHQSNLSELKGEYLGQNPPGPVPEVFAAGIVSTGFDELNSVFSPDGKEFYFSIKLPGQVRHTMMVMKSENNRWSAPTVLPFSGQYGDADPAFSANGKRLFFISQRPLNDDGELKDWDIWYVDRKGDDWSTPKPLKSPVNSDQHEICPSITNDATLYFSSNRTGKFKIYRSRFRNGSYLEPENIGNIINPESSEGDLFIARDESYIIFSARRSDGFGRNDLYISFRTPDDFWTITKNMGAKINSSTVEYCPYISPDEKFLFFTCYRKSSKQVHQRITTYQDFHQIYSKPQNGLGDIYWVDAKVIEELKTKELE